jgi:hypothetical protein
MRRDNRFVNGFFLDFILFLFAFWLGERQVRNGRGWRTALTLDDDGGLKQKKMIDRCLMIVSSRRSISDLCTRLALPGHTIT